MSEEQRIIDLGAEKIRRAKRIHALNSIEDPQEKHITLLADAAFCQAQPIYWIREYGWVRAEKIALDEPELIDCPFDLWPSQIDLALWFLAQAAAREPALCVKSREIGVTWLVEHLLYHAWRYSRATSHLISRDENLVDRRGDLDCLMEKLRYIHRWQPDHIRAMSILDKHLLIQNPQGGQSLRGSTTTHHSGRGGRSWVAFVDEFNAIDPSIAANLVTALEANARSVWMVYNANGTGHAAHELRTTLSASQVRVVRWTADPYRDDAWKRSKLRPPNGTGLLSLEQFAQEYDCDETAVLSGRIWSCNVAQVLYGDEDFPAAVARRSWFHAGGWDFGSGPSKLVCLFSVVEFLPNGFPRIWIDHELTWKSETWYDAADRVIGIGQDYKGPAIHYGDPSGVNRESDQESWQTNLRSKGLPVFCLPAYFNTQEGKEWAIKNIQWMLNEGMLRVHRKCVEVQGVLAQWQRNIPDGVNPDHFNRAYIGPRHDGWSHAGHALLYLVGGVLAYAQQTRKVAEPAKSLYEKLPSAAAEMASMLKTARGF